jgi:hypothetical protein
MNEDKNNITGEIKMYNSSDEETTDYLQAVRAEKNLDGSTYKSNEKDNSGDWKWVTGGKKRGSSKKSKKSKKMGGRKSKKSKKGGKRSKTRKH